MEQEGGIMRLIDADAFCKEMKDRQNECSKWRDETDEADIKIRADGALSAFIECKLTLDKMPTFEERKTGKWEQCTIRHEYGSTMLWGCSSCRKLSMGTYNYCPNCGARMET